MGSEAHMWPTSALSSAGFPFCLNLSGYAFEVQYYSTLIMHYCSDTLENERMHLPLQKPCGPHQRYPAPASPSA